MSFEQTWAAANPDAGGQTDDLDPPADGSYEVTLTDADAFLSKKGDAYVKLEWKQEQLDHTWTVLLGFKTEGQANVTKRQVRELGVAVDGIGSLAELADALKELVGHFFKVTIKTNGKFRNTYIDGPANGALTVGDVPNDIPVSTGAAGSDDDVPFRARFPEGRNVTSWSHFD